MVNMKLVGMLNCVNVRLLFVGLPFVPFLPCNDFSPENICKWVKKDEWKCNFVDDFKYIDLTRRPSAAMTYLATPCWRGVAWAAVESSKFVSDIAALWTVLLLLLFWLLFFEDFSLVLGRDGTRRCPYDSSWPCSAFSMPSKSNGSNGASFMADSGRGLEVLRRRTTSFRSSVKALQQKKSVKH